MGGISADDDLAVEKLTKKLEGLESLQATMKAVNAYFRKHKTLDGCPELTRDGPKKPSEWRSHGTWTKVSRTPPICFPTTGISIKVSLFT